MKALESLVPIIAAGVTAFGVIWGNYYLKSLERDADIQKKQQEVYFRVLRNITDRNTRQGLLLQQSREYLAAKPEARHQVEQRLQERFQMDPELSKNEGERTEVVASLCLFGTDEAIHAYAQYAKANMRGEGGDVGQLVLALRHSVFKQTHIAADEAYEAIWNVHKEPR